MLLFFIGVYFESNLDFHTQLIFYAWAKLPWVNYELTCVPAYESRTRVYLIAVAFYCISKLLNLMVKEKMSIHLVVACTLVYIFLKALIYFSEHLKIDKNKFMLKCFFLSHIVYWIQTALDELPIFKPLQIWRWYNLQHFVFLLL